MTNLKSDQHNARRIELSFVVINYFSADLATKLITHINSFNAPKNTNISIICVDNSAQIDQQRSLERTQKKSRHPLTLIVNPDNQGFGHAINTALKNHFFDYFFCINPDVTLHETSLDTLLTHAVNNADQGLWGGLTVDEHSKADYRHAWQEPSLTNTLGWALGLKHLIRQPQWQDNYRHKVQSSTQPYPVDSLSGCCFLMSAPAWRATQGFDINFFLYSEEIDLCRRARSAGYQPTVVPQATLTHSTHTKSESIKRVPIIYSAKLRYAQKHHGLTYNLLFRLAVAIGTSLRGLKALILGQIPACTVWAKLTLKALFSIRNFS